MNFLKLRTSGCIILLLCGLAFPLYSQAIPAPIVELDPYSGRVKATFLLSQPDSIIRLPHRFIFESSEEVVLDSTVLAKPEDYLIDYRSGLVTFSKSFWLRRQQDSSILVIRYRVLAYPFRESYSRHRLMKIEDTSDARGATVVRSTAPFSVDDMFGPGLQKSGSIFRGFTVGSNQDLSLRSGFRMTLSGTLTDDIDVVAALTDENSPIQPEGTTQTLQEVDKVFIELSSTSYGATLGDFNVEIGPKEGGEFGRLFRKVQGAQGVARYSTTGTILGDGRLSLSAATTRGKYQTNQFKGLEGTQGPYRLTGRNGERRIIVIAGTERVYLNGAVMTRGETNDYVIDYASAEVHFTTKRLITNASRISVDFEYTDRQYTRNLLAFTSTSSVGGDAVRINAVALQEADDPDAPIELSLDEQTRAILRESGADRFKASVSGIRLIGRDSLTNAARGQYSLRDTLINTRSYQILVYEPGDSLALYSANFSIVDRMPADSAGYVRVGIGHFRFAGIGQGNYLPLQFLPLPQRHRLIDVSAEAAITNDLTLSAEYAGSELDRNRFSRLDDASNAGGAFRFQGRYNPRRVEIGGTNIGELDASFRQRVVDRRFVAPDRFTEVEFDRKWNITDASTGDETLSLRAGYGRFERKGTTRATRAEAGAVLSDSIYPQLTYQLENIETEHIPSQTTSSWLRQQGGAEYRYGLLVPGLRVESEDRQTVGAKRDSVLPGSFKILEIAPRLGVPTVGMMSASAEFHIRREDSAVGGKLERAMHSLTQQYGWQLREWQSLSSSLTLSIRNAQFTEMFKNRGNVNSEVILVRSLSRYSPFQRGIESELFYEFASLRSAKLERVFVRVPRGTGNYHYRGDLNGNNIADDDEFELTRFDGDYVTVLVPSEQLFPVVDLKASTRLRLRPARLIGSSQSLLASVVRSISTETYVRVDEKSSEPLTHRIYLLHLSRFQNPATTISGSNQLQQDLHLMEDRPDLSLRFRFNQRKGLIQYVGSIERSYLRERSVRIRSQLIPEIGNTTEFINKRDRVLASVPNTRERDLLSNALSSDFSYRPLPRWEIGFRFDVSQVVDEFQALNTTADINEQSVRLVYAFAGLGQLRGEIKREEVVLTNATVVPGRIVPYEFTGGRVIGKTFLWQLAADYRITQNVQMSVHYSGRVEGQRPAVHTARVEARAFF
jgi:hypothetical protein